MLKSLRRGSFLTHIEATKPLYITPSPISLSSPARRYDISPNFYSGLVSWYRTGSRVQRGRRSDLQHVPTLLRLLIIHLCLRVTLTLPYHPLPPPPPSTCTPYSRGARVPLDPSLTFTTRVQAFPRVIVNILRPLFIRSMKVTVEENWWLLISG